MHPPSNIPEPNTPSSLLSSTHVHVADLYTFAPFGLRALTNTHLHSCHRAVVPISNIDYDQLVRRFFSDLPPVPGDPAACPWFLASWQWQHQLCCRAACLNPGILCKHQAYGHMVDLVAPKEVSTCSYTCRRKRGGKDSAPANQNKSVLPGFQIQRERRRPSKKSENWQCNGTVLNYSSAHLTRTTSQGHYH